jgi:hypothetical protein
MPALHLGATVEHFTQMEGQPVSQIPPGPQEPDDLQFYSVEPTQPPPAMRGGQKLVVKGPTCVACKRSIAHEYFAVSDKIVCPMCRDRLAAELAGGGSKVGRLSKATIFGIAAGFAGALVWYLVRLLTKMQIGLVAVAVGFMVGAAVRAGSGGRGGRGYQVLALILTWFAIGANYMPDIIKVFVDDYRTKHSTAVTSAVSPEGASTDKTESKAPTPTVDAAPAAAPAAPKRVGVGAALLAIILLIIVAVALSFIAPILGNLTSPIGWIIVGFALWEAWKINAGRRVVITGPFTVGSAGGAGGVRP